MKKKNKNIALTIILIIGFTLYIIFGGKNIAQKSGMTWGILEVSSISIGSVSSVSCFGNPHPENSKQCDEKKGDTSCTKTLPILCIKKNSVAPMDLSDISVTNKYAKWGGGDISLSNPVSGMDLRSRSNADSICTSQFGPSWKMAEFHDGSEYGFRGKGSIPGDTRFWVANKDEDANCW